MGRKKTNSKVITYDEMLIPTLEALKLLGGSGSIVEINEMVYEVIGFDEKTLEIPHAENGIMSEVDYRLAWSRTYLKKYGLLENSTRGIWALLDNDIDTKSINPNEIVKFVRELSKKSKTNQAKIKNL